MFRWILNQVWEKVNLAHAYRELKELGKKHGKRFFIAAVLWEMVEDIVFPFLSWLFGVPELIPVFLVLHFEPIVYPAFFWGFRTWDRAHGKEPWEPDRSAQSTYWRSVVKVAVFQAVSLGWLSHFIPWKPLLAYAVLISLFSFIHERIWHDSNWGIKSDDSVQLKRTAGKVGTYMLIGTFVLFPLLRINQAANMWSLLLVSQSVTAILYLVLELVWARSLWGVMATPIRSQWKDRNKSGDGCTKI